MDESVLHAIERWPNVPAVYGWLSLTERGQWRLHPDGQAMAGGAGESIGNPQILSFINRNYACDQHHQWFFQNGPQRVYVRLDAAPWIINADDSTGLLTTHTDLTISHVSALFVDGDGRLYLQTEHGSGLLMDRDLPRFIDDWHTPDGQALDAWWFDRESSHTTTIKNPSRHWAACGDQLNITRLSNKMPIGQQLQFVANPKPCSE